METVTISLSEYESLIEDSIGLSCLQDAGVDNWGGMDFAQELLSERNPDNEED